MTDDTTPLSGNETPEEDTVGASSVEPPTDATTQTPAEPPTDAPVDPPTDAFPADGFPTQEPTPEEPAPSDVPMLAVGATEPAADAPTPPKKGGAGKKVAILVGVLAIVAGGAFAATQLSGPKSNTPEEAVEDMLTAVAKGDVIGMVEALAPGERDVLIDSFVPMIEELRRLEVFDTSLDLKGVSGITGSLQGFTATSTKLRDDLAAVRITAGTLTTRFDPSKLPLGKLIRENLEQEIDSASEQRTVSKLRMPADGDRIVVIKEGGRWYFSGGYSIAEASRRDGDNPGEYLFEMPAKGAGVAAKGADTPEDAVKQFLGAAAALDVRRIIELMPPKELGALHDYAGEFVDQAEEAVRSATDGQYELSFPGMELAADRDGNRAFVTIVSTGINFGLTDPNAPEFRAIYENKNRCVTLTLDGDTKKRCGADVVKFLDDFGVPVDQAQIEDQLKLQGVNGKKPKVGFSTVKQDGKWFVSPTRTVLDDATAYLKIISKEDLATYEQQVKDTISGLNGSTDLTDDPSLGDPTFDTGDSSDTTMADPLFSDDTTVDTADTTAAEDPLFSDDTSGDTADTTAAQPDSPVADTIA